MAKSKYESHVAPRLEEIKDWCRNGATDEDIYTQLGISKDTFYEYKKKYSDFSDTLKHTRDYCDGEIENALYKAAMSGNVTAMIFWLKNRRGKKWREKPEEESDANNNGVAISINIADCREEGVNDEE